MPVGLDSEQPGVHDALFVNDALIAGSRQIEIARLGIENSHNPDLTLLAQEIYDDNVRANQELRIIAERENIPVPSIATETVGIAIPQGPDFDALFIQQLFAAHEGDIKTFQAAARNAQNTEVRDFAARVLPALQEHYRIAQNITKTAGLNAQINEPAGAERPVEQEDPFYKGDPDIRHQFNNEF